MPKKPPLAARLRLPLGYIVIFAAFFVNDGNLRWSALPVILLGSAIRMWSAGTLVKTRELTTFGPYALSRNPLYLGTFIAGCGLALFVHSWPLLLFFVVSFAVAYSAQIAWEEKLLTREHGQAFVDYSRAVGRFFPIRSPAGRVLGAFSFSRLLHNKELAYQIFWLVMILGLVSQAYLRAAGLGFAHP